MEIRNVNSFVIDSELTSIIKIFLMFSTLQTQQNLNLKSY